jgi:hypothetical protein
MPILLLLAGSAGIGALAATLGAGTANSTQQPSTIPVGGGVDEFGWLKWPIIIGGTVFIIKYGNKILKKV